MPIFGNNQIDDSSCAWVTGRTCSLRIGVYLTGCLRDLVPLQGKGMSDRLPGGISGDWGEGLTHSSVGSSSGSALGPSGSAGVDCSRMETSAGHVSRSASTSGLSVKSPDNFCSGPEGDSNGASNTAGATSGRAGLAVKDSSISTGSSVVLGIAIWGSEISATGAGSGPGDELSTGSCTGGVMSTTFNSRSWRTGCEVCISWSQYCTGQSVSIQLDSCSPKSG